MSHHWNSASMGNLLPGCSKGALAGSPTSLRLGKAFAKALSAFKKGAGHTSDYDDLQKEEVSWAQSWLSHC